MKILENIVNKIHSEKGLTGVDVAAAITIIVVTIGVITGIYINIVNGSKENIRYSAATRIATQITENIQAMSYDEVMHASKLEIGANESEEERKILNVTVPQGYAAKVTVIDLASEVDFIKKIKVEVSYKAGKNSYDTVNLQVIKQRELLEQTNKPELELIPNFLSSSKYFYPIKLTSDGYVVTTTSDKDWYNYDIGYYAIIYASNMEKEIGDIVAPNNGEKYVWIPRFAKIEDTQISRDNFTFLYGTSKHKIVFKNIDVAKNFYSYTIDYASGNYNDAGAYVENTFEDNDGLAGVWYLMGSTENALISETAFNALNQIFEMKN